MIAYRMPGGELADSEVAHCLKCGHATAWSLSRSGSVFISKLQYCPSCGYDVRGGPKQEYSVFDAVQATLIYQQRTRAGCMRVETTPFVDSKPDDQPCKVPGHDRYDVTRVGHDRVHIRCLQCGREWRERKLTISDIAGRYAARSDPVSKG